MPTAYSYLRFSSEKQSQGDGQRRQRALAEAYCEKQNLPLDPHTHADLGISAFKGKNVRDGALGAFLKAVDQGVIPSNSILIVESLDRISRGEVMDALEVFTGIVNRGLTLITLQDEQVFSRDTLRENPTKLIMSIVVMMRANEESATKSKRLQASHTARRVKAQATREIMTAKAPLWIRTLGTRPNQTFELIPAGLLGH